MMSLKLLIVLLTLVGCVISRETEIYEHTQKSGIDTYRGHLDTITNGNINIKVERGYRVHAIFENFLTVSKRCTAGFTIYDGAKNGTNMGGCVEGSTTSYSGHFVSSSNLMTIVFAISKSNNSFTLKYKQTKIRFPITPSLSNADICKDNQVPYKTYCLETILFDVPTSYTNAVKACASSTTVTVITGKDTQIAIEEATELALQLKKTHRVDPFRIFVAGEFLPENNKTGIIKPGYYYKNVNQNVHVEGIVWDEKHPIEKNAGNTTTPVNVAFNWYISKVAQKVRLHTVKCTEKECDEDVRGIVCNQSKTKAPKERPRLNAPSLPRPPYATCTSNGGAPSTKDYEIGPNQYLCDLIRDISYVPLREN